MPNTPDISYHYTGIDKSYSVTVDGIGVVYTTKDRRDARMFVAELKIKAMQSDKSFEATPANPDALLILTREEIDKRHKEINVQPNPTNYTERLKYIESLLEELLKNQGYDSRFFHKKWNKPTK